MLVLTVMVHMLMCAPMGRGTPLGAGASRLQRWAPWAHASTHAGGGFATVARPACAPRAGALLTLCEGSGPGMAHGTVPTWRAPGPAPTAPPCTTAGPRPRGRAQAEAHRGRRRARRLPPWPPAARCVWPRGRRRRPARPTGAPRASLTAGWARERGVAWTPAGPRLRHRWAWGRWWRAHSSGPQRGGGQTLPRGARRGGGQRRARVRPRARWA